MLQPPQTNITVPSVPDRKDKLLNEKRRLDRFEDFMNRFSISFSGKDVLEIGAYDGATAYALAMNGANRVLATDIAAYYIHQQLGGSISPQEVRTENQKLDSLRKGYAEIVEEENIRGRVIFQEDDICSSDIRSESVDIIISQEVLEHLTDPEKAFQHMHRVLKHGGAIFCEYNPFFSLTGGHSLCTLDFLWGHARLSDFDFERYLTEFRPQEKEVDLSFYHNNLNRMTISKLREYVLNAGFSTLSILPWLNKRHLDLVTPEALQQCVDIYPTAEMIDLISPSVWVLMKKE